MIIGRVWVSAGKQQFVDRIQIVPVSGLKQRRCTVGPWRVYVHTSRQQYLDRVRVLIHEGVDEPEAPTGCRPEASN